MHIRKKNKPPFLEKDHVIRLHQSLLDQLHVLFGNISKQQNRSKTTNLI